VRESVRGPTKDGETRIIPVLDELHHELTAWKLKTGGKGLVVPAMRRDGKRVYSITVTEKHYLHLRPEHFRAPISGSSTRRIGRKLAVRGGGVAQSRGTKKKTPEWSCKPRPTADERGRADLRSSGVISLASAIGMSGRAVAEGDLAPENRQKTGSAGPALPLVTPDLFTRAAAIVAGRAAAGGESLGRIEEMIARGAAQAASLGAGISP
jgi:hypothetical protein